jgi:2-polyprenyl-3-methyl-5-hydroxy-6-metoxy-1,4-benzoquinol methylase
MELNELLGIGDFTLVEESYANQKWIGRTLEYLRKVEEADVAEAIRIVAESGDRELMGTALYDRGLGFWIIFTDVIADMRSKEEFEALAGEIKGAKERVVEVAREKLREAVIEFYSIGLVNRLFCDCDIRDASFYPRERTAALKKVLDDFLTGIEEKESALEIGCGNGGATIALHESGIFPIAVDINKCEICKGIEEGVLEPKRSIVLDCAHLSAFFSREFDVVFGFMIGKLTSGTMFEWERVLREVHKVLRDRGHVLFTVSSEEEAEMVKELLKEEFVGEIKENTGSDGYLDHWVYEGTRRG